MIDTALLAKLASLSEAGLPDRLSAIVDLAVAVAREPRNEPDPLTMQKDLHRIAEFLRKTDGPNALEQARQFANTSCRSTFARSVVSTIEWQERQERRLAELYCYDILDTPTEVDFDDIVFIAAHVCEAPIAAINFIDKNRQWSKAAIGTEGGAMSLEDSICATDLDRAGILVIPDMRRDARTKNLSSVAHDGLLRFYASAPLVTPSGTIIGRLCVVDTANRPDGLSAAQSSIMEGLARQVMAQMELRRLLLDRSSR